MARALATWRANGIYADRVSLDVLQSIDSQDQTILSASDWKTAQSVKAILQAKILGLSARTADQLPFYVRAASRNSLDTALARQVTSRLTDGGLVPASGPSFAAVIIDLGTVTFQGIPDYDENGRQKWGVQAKLSFAVRYNFSPGDVIPPLAITGNAIGIIDDTQDKLQKCALLEAGLSAADRLLTSADLRSPLVKPGC